MSRWRRRARLAVLLFLAVSFAWGGVRLADPIPKVPGAQPVAPDAPAAEIAHDAMRQTEAGNYEVELHVGNGTQLRHTGTFQVDNVDRQVSSTGFDESGEAVSEAYAAEGGLWTRDLQDGSPASFWRVDRMPRLDRGRFWNDDAVLREGANVSVVERNETTLVVRVNDTDTAALLARNRADVTGYVTPFHASLTLAVDRETGLLRWSRFHRTRVRDDGTKQVHVYVQRFDRWGEVDVRQPPSIPYDFDATYKDLLNHCPGCTGAER